MQYKRYTYCKSVCSAKGLKQCAVSDEVKNSFCGKAAYQINGSKPVMIILAGLAKTKENNRKQKEIDGGSDDSCEVFEIESVDAVAFQNMRVTVIPKWLRLKMKQ